MKKTNIIIISLISIIIIFLIAIIIAMSVFETKLDGEIREETKISEVILDDCTDEYENGQEEIITTNTEQEKISPNCKIVLTKYYKGCKDYINEYLQVPDNLVNMTKDDLQRQYKEWEIKEFSSSQIHLYKEFDGTCTEHYILREKDGKILINKISENGEEILYEKTDISIDYLTPKDKNEIEKGLKINGKENLNKLIENFE